MLAKSSIEHVAEHAEIHRASPARRPALVDVHASREEMRAGVGRDPFLVPVGGGDEVARLVAAAAGVGDCLVAGIPVAEEFTLEIHVRRRWDASVGESRSRYAVAAALDVCPEGRSWTLATLPKVGSRGSGAERNPDALRQ